MDLNELRVKIDDIDNEIVRLFAERMEICGDIAEYKKENHLSVLDPTRERAKLADVRQKAGEKFGDHTALLYSSIFEISRTYQDMLTKKETKLSKRIKEALADTPQLFPEHPLVACQGVEGAYSQIATEKLFKSPNIMFFNNFEAVFSAIANDMCLFGVLPLENSTAGSVNSIYDLMMRHKFSIVRSVRLKIDHNLLAKKGTSLSEVKEIFSHEQAINQSAGFLKKLAGVKITVCENTAMAAKMVAESDRTDVAALSSRSCAEIYGLDTLAESVQDKHNNYTRFICIAKDLQIYPGADRTSVMLTTKHKAGSLYRLIARINALQINLLKLESRPIPDRDFEFMFYFDMETSVYSPRFIQMICELEDLCETFEYLGSYSEVV